MKKVFVVFMSCVLLFSFALPFGVHAAEVHSEEFPLGEWVLNDNLDVQTLIDISDDVGGNKVSYVDFAFYSGFHERTVECEGFSPVMASNGTLKLRYLISGGQYYQVYAGASFTRDTDKVINITSVPSDSAVIEWLYANATPPQGEPEPEPEPMCDGTACSWADDDYNGICDTCGLALMSFRYDLLQYAYDFLNGSFSDHTYWVITQETIFPSDDIIYNVYKSRTPFKYGGGGLYTDGDSYIYGAVMMGSDGVPTSVWWKTAEGQTISLVDVNSPVDSSHDIDNFFPLGLRQMIQQVVESEMATLIQKVVGPMKILMVCGVGLMACLVVLNLFGKRSLISLKQ